ncbi:MAG TPA: glycosyltransferase 87 family protein [Vicinamibacteria bacterium]
MARADRLFHPYALAALVLGLALVAAPFVHHHYDVVDCFLAWSRASEGSRPWGVYTPGAGADDCDYPPLVPYWLTAVEAARRAASAPEVGALTLTLLKLPNLLAAFAGVPLCLRGLRAPFGEPTARYAATAYALSPALFVNGLWGQFDTLLAFFVLAAVVAALHDRPGLVGVALGFGLATKLLAIVAAPLLAVYLFRRGGIKAVALASATGVAAMLALALPLVLGGAGDAVLRAYTGAVHYYPYRTAEAYNSWYVADRFDVLVRGLSYPDIRRDDRLALGGVTYQALGLGAFVLATGVLMATLWKRPHARLLVSALTLHLFAFFMLPTQVHQRYIVPAVALAAVLCAVRRDAAWLYFGLTLTGTLNQALDLARALPMAEVVRGALTADLFALPLRTWRDLGALVGLANIALFVAAVWVFWRRRPSWEASE